MITQTPETDSKSACIFAELGPNNNWRFSAMCDFARKLELERNEARASARQEKEHHEFYRQKCSDYMGAEQGWLKVQAERDALRRKVAAAEGMAEAIESSSLQTLKLRAALTAWQEANRDHPPRQ